MGGEVERKEEEGVRTVLRICYVRKKSVFKNRKKIGIQHMSML